jgi:hypothetical protein
VTKVLILGCGPAGLMAAAAAKEAGFDPMIVSKKRKSEMYGAQYLHAQIPGYSPDMSFDVNYTLFGTAEEYRRKVYGNDARVTVSPEDLPEDHEGWDIRETYNNLWMKFQEDIHDVAFESGAEVHGFVNSLLMTGAFPHVLSTIPARILCINPAHQFPSQRIWAIGDAPERGIFSPIRAASLNQVICSGGESSWYRCANILGYVTAEWPANKRPPLEGVAPVDKPLNTNCDCLPEVHRLGRFGKWQKGVLSHTAYYETLEGLSFREEVPAATE